MMQIQGITERAVAFYRRQGFCDFVKATLVYFLKKCRTLPLIRTIIGRYRLSRLVKEKTLKLHLGCGSIHLDGYTNIDIQDWAGTCDLVADATNRYMFEDTQLIIYLPMHCSSISHLGTL